MPAHSFLLGIGLLVGVGSLVVAGPVDAAGPGPGEAAEFFEARVRPLLLDACVRCHGAKKQSSGLRLDSREAMLEGGENGPAIVPGDPDKSLLVQVVRQTHEDIRMPPKGKLADPAIAVLADWVKAGALWPRGIVLSPAERDQAADTHWAFRPPRAAAVPAVKDAAWGTTPIDAFILARLEAEGIHPSPRADRRTLIRRATFDLTGLPPTAAEIDAFEADRAPDAFARVVDRLLASPRYGERWGRHWLDVARYADTKGYVFAEERRYPYAYTYRDYVIRAFNDDLPYDQFVVEQIAADQLPPGPARDRGALAALGFLTVGRRFLNNQQDIIDDRIDVVSRGLLGLTVACARCHDHKFDPIPTDDYYSLYGVFASSVEPTELPELPQSQSSPDASDFERKRKERQARVDEFLASRRAAIQADLRGKAGAYFLAAFDLGFEPRNPKLDERARAETLSTGRLRWAIGRWKAYLESVRDRPDAAFGPWQGFAALPASGFAEKAKALAESLAAEASSGRRGVVERLAAKPPSSLRDVAMLYAELLTSAAAAEKDKVPPGAIAEVRRILDDPEGPTTVRDDSLARLVDRAERNQLKKLMSEVTSLAASHAGAPPRAMVLNDAPRPTDPHVFVRGNPGRPGKAVPRQFLKVLSGADRKPFRQGSGRLELARAIADPRNPLTARVLVNRVWMFHFGTGLVATPSDFGLRSDPPSHPELLDALALEFLRAGWSIKALHRRIMLSGVYQQTSGTIAANETRDPNNRLLWRYPRRRLDFESMRDALLAVSGHLDDSMGGRSLPINEPPFSPRRTVYGFIDRQNLDGLYRTFDFASPDATSPRRYVTTVPQQALFLMNSPFVLETAQRLARGLDPSAGPEERIGSLYRRIFGRSPEPHETALGLRFIGQRSHDASAPVPPLWQQGFGRVDEEKLRVVRFATLSNWTGKAWQFGSKLPDPEMGYLHLSPTGGHVGRDARDAAIRRWTAPRDGLIAIEGTLDHEAKEGDGVRGRIVASHGGELGQWVAHHARRETSVARYRVKKGETIDFVVDGRAEPSFDSFLWSPLIRELGSSPAEWKSQAGFEGPPAPRPSPWEEYAQVLLLTNEFMFVD